MQSIISIIVKSYNVEHKSLTPWVATYLSCGGYLNMSLLQIYHWVCQRKNCENQLLFGEVMGESLVSCFSLTHGVVILH